MKSFLLTLLELAKLRGSGWHRPGKAKKVKLSFTRCAKRINREMDLSREQFFNFEIVPFRIDDELLAGLANTDEFEDGIGASYPMDEWHNPPSV